MTEQEWEESVDPEKMLAAIRDKASDRKLRLFACACWRLRLRGDEIPDGESALQVAEGFAEGRLTADQLPDLPNPVTLLIWSLRDETAWEAGRWAARGGQFHAKSEAREARLTPEARKILEHMDVMPDLTGPHCIEAAKRVSALQASFLQDIFGNPFASSHVEIDWPNSTMLALAKAASEARDPLHFPILTDALEDAGCCNQTILSHLRSPGPHVRGCWVIDFLLGKE